MKKSIYSISERNDHQWCVSLGQQLLRTQLCPAIAINLARQLARDYHRATGCPSRVEFIGGSAPIVLGRYGLQ